MFAESCKWIVNTDLLLIFTVRDRYAKVNSNPQKS
jgi:hypothetical protein